MKTSLKCEAQGESGGYQSPPTGDEEGGESCRTVVGALIVNVGLQTGRLILLRKLGTGAADALRRENNCGYRRRVKQQGVFNVARRHCVYSWTAAAATEAATRLRGASSWGGCGREKIENVSVQYT